MNKPHKLGFDEEYFLEMPSTKDDYLDWISLKDRRIILNDNIDATTINKVSHWINRWNSEDSELNLPKELRKTIHLDITSNGGDVVSGLNVLDVIQNSETPVVTTAFGCACSMGAYILIGSQKRRAYKNTVILLHDGSLAVQGSSRKAKNTMTFYDKLDERVKELVLKHTNITEEMYDSKYDEEWYMFADEALELGIIDEII